MVVDVKASCTRRGPAFPQDGRTTMDNPRKRRPEKARIDPQRAGFETLLVATDFTQGATWAVGRAARLSFLPGAKAFILHVVPDGIPPEVRSRADSDARRILDEVVASAFGGGTQSESAGEAATSVVRVGKPYVEIIREARAGAAELVVVGRHGRRTVRDLFLGSTAERVIRMGSSPVLVVNRKPSHPYRRVLIALDLGDTSHATVDLALRVVGPGAVDVSVFNAYGAPFEGFIATGLTSSELGAYRRDLRETSRSLLRDFLESLGGRGAGWNAAVRCGDPRVEILREAEKRHADLIVLGTHGRTGISHALLGSVAEWVVRKATRDVLVARSAPVAFDLP
jgi:nucleotide-binding universal stress UspA family protein